MIERKILQLAPVILAQPDPTIVASTILQQKENGDIHPVELGRIVIVSAILSIDPLRLPLKPKGRRRRTPGQAISGPAAPGRQ